MTFLQNSELLSKAKLTAWNEMAWGIEDALQYCRYALENDIIILGGDILYKDMTYTYDNWYYITENQKTHKENVVSSYAVAEQYIREYVLRNGYSFYVVIVAEKG